MKSDADAYRNFSALDWNAVATKKPRDRSLCAQYKLLLEERFSAFGGCGSVLAALLKVTCVELYLLILSLVLMAVAAFALLVMAMGALAYLVFVFAMLRVFVRGLTRMRFSLRSMMLTVIGGAACGTLLSNPQHPMVFKLGIVSGILAVAFLVSYTVVLGICEK